MTGTRASTRATSVAGLVGLLLVLALALSGAPAAPGGLAGTPGAAHVHAGAREFSDQGLAAAALAGAVTTRLIQRTPFSGEAAAAAVVTVGLLSLVARAVLGDAARGSADLGLARASRAPPAAPSPR